MIFKDNPSYKEACKSDKHIFYTPINIAEGYHVSRFIAGNAQNMYSASGITKELHTTMLNKILDIVNDDKSNTGRVKSDVATIANNLLYRTRYPVDEECLIRMGAIYCFIEGEDPDTVDDLWTQKKMKVAKEDRKVYDFFIETGWINTPAYKDLLPVLNDSEYFQKRQAALESLTLGQ